MERLELNTFKKVNRNFVKHTGTILRVEKSVVTVSLEGNINCEGCKAQSACGISDSSNKNIEIFNSNQSFKLSEPVYVIIEKSLGLKVVFWAYVFPFILMMLTLLITSSFLKEWLAGLISIFVLVPYYFMLYVFKEIFKKAFKFSILKHN